MIRLTRAQVREVDRRAIEQYGIPGIVLMENAARAVADAAWEMVNRRSNDVYIVCGSGNNGGDGYAIARHLHNRGCYVYVCEVGRGRQTTDAALNRQIVKAMNIAFTTLECVKGPHGFLVIDAVFGTGLKSAPSPPIDEVVDAIHGADGPILSVDVPSGLDCDTGKPLGACVRATKTVTFVAEKAGFANNDSKEFTGREIIVGDIGCPHELIEEVAKMSPT